MAKADATLRVALGSPTEPFSSVWRFWVNRSDVYIAARILAGLFKISLHESGVWVLAFTSESGAVFESNRRGMTWRRPPEFAPGWTMGPSISIPRLDNSPLLAKRATDKAPIHWLTPPAVGSARWLTVVFCRCCDDDRREIVPGSEDVGSLELSNGESVWVLGGERPLTDQEKRPIRDVRRPLKIDVEDPNRVDAASVIWCTTSPAGPPLIVEILLGPDNVRAAAVDRGS